MNIIVLSGSPLCLPLLRKLLVSGFLSALICPQENVASDCTPLHEWAVRNSVPCWDVTRQTQETELTELISETKPDLILVFGFPYSIPPSLLKDVKHGGWNVHFSLQPENQGTITIHQLKEGGEKIVSQEKMTLVVNEETASPLYQLSLVSVTLLYRSLAGI